MSIRATARENHSPLVTLDPPGSGPHWWKASVVTALATVLSLLVECTLSFMLLLTRLLYGDGEVANDRKFKGQCNRCILKNVVKISVKRFPSCSSFFHRRMFSCITLTGFGVT